MSCRVTPSTSHRPARISSAARRSRCTSSAGTASRAPAGRGDSKRGARPASASPGIRPAQRASCRGAAGGNLLQPPGSLPEDIGGPPQDLLR